MIKIENVETAGWEAAIRGMRNPMNSWDKSDSYYDLDGKFYILGPNDKELAAKLAKAGPVHGKFLRMIQISMDITAPLYWWKEFDTYKVGTVADSCSTMHKIHAKEFTVDDFSTEHLISRSWSEADNYGELKPMEVFLLTIKLLNESRISYLKAKENKDEPRAKMFWWQMIQLLPSSYNQRRTVTINYQVAANIFEYRKDHKLDEWHELCKELLKLPYSWDLIAYKKN